MTWFLNSSMLSVCGGQVCSLWEVHLRTALWYSTIPSRAAGCSSLVGCLPSMCRVLSSIPSTIKKEENNNNETTIPSKESYHSPNTMPRERHPLRLSAHNRCAYSPKDTWFYTQRGSLFLTGVWQKWLENISATGSLFPTYSLLSLKICVTMLKPQGPCVGKVSAFCWVPQSSLKC